MSVLDTCSDTNTLPCESAIASGHGNTFIASAMLQYNGNMTSEVAKMVSSDVCAREEHWVTQMKWW